MPSAAKGVVPRISPNPRSFKMFEVPKTSQPQMYPRPKSKSKPQDMPSNDYYKGGM